MESGQYGEAGNVKKKSNVQKTGNILNVNIFHQENGMEIGQEKDAKMSSTHNLQSSDTQIEQSNQSQLVAQQECQSASGQTLREVQPERRIYNNYIPENGHLYSGPFYAYLEHKEKNVGKLHEMAIGQILHVDLGIKNKIKEISKVGLNRVKIEMHKARDVYELVNNPVLKSKNFHTYVPLHLTERKGVIRQVDTMLSEDYLMNNIEGTGIVKEVRRINKKITNKDNEVVQVARQTIVVTFVGNNLPSTVYINSCRREVIPYIYRVTQCMKCLRFGHVVAQCKSTEKLCKTCGKPVHEEVCEEGTRTCRNCSATDHDALSKNCPIYIREKSIKSKMAECNITYRDAKNIIENPNSFANIARQNKFGSLADLDDLSEFPPLKANQVATHRKYTAQQQQSTKQIPSQMQKKRKFQSVESPSYPRPEPFFDFRQLPLKPLPPNTKTGSNTNYSQDEVHPPLLSGTKYYQLIEGITSFINEIMQNSKDSPINGRDINDKYIRDRLVTLLEVDSESS